VFGLRGDLTEDDFNLIEKKKRKSILAGLLLPDAEPGTAALDHHPAREADRRTETAHAVGVGKGHPGAHHTVKVRGTDVRIAQRGRTFEQNIAPEYLENLNVLYERWMRDFSLCPVLTVPSDDLDFVHKPQHLDHCRATHPGPPGR
jgi:hypothetical protein